MLIIATQNFELVSHDSPEVSRTDGGHLKINPKIAVNDRTELSKELLMEMSLLSHLAGRAMKKGLADRGITIGRINYQENGNWNPKFHLHLYGRAVDAVYQVYGEPIRTARKLEDKVIQESLTAEDCESIRKVAINLSKEPFYSDLKLVF